MPLRIVLTTQRVMMNVVMKATAHRKMGSLPGSTMSSWNQLKRE